MQLHNGFAMAASQKIFFVKHINVKCNDFVSSLFYGKLISKKNLRFLAISIQYWFSSKAKAFKYNIRL